MGGAHALEHEAFFALQHEAIALRRRRARRLGRVMPRPLVQREGNFVGSVVLVGEQGGLLGFAASEALGAGAHEGNQERRGRQVFPRASRTRPKVR